MKFVFFDGPEWDTLYPLTLTRSVSELLIGLSTLGEKWGSVYKSKVSFICSKEYLLEKYPLEKHQEDFIFINPSFIPKKELLEEIAGLKKSQALFYKDKLVAFYGNYEDSKNKKGLEGKQITFPLIHIQYPWDLFLYNQEVIKNDLEILKTEREFILPNDTNRLIHKENIFMEEGAIVNHSILNASDGPIYIGKDVQIMEGSLLRGSLALCKGAQIKMGSKIYGGTTIGSFSKVAGEVQNVILFPYSNKAHDGFLGHSIIGSWCNLGAGTNTSNLKNNYSKVRVWNESIKKYQPINIEFCGLIMGDHSKCAIGINFNTATTVGVFANIFTHKTPPKHIPSFSWGIGKKLKKYELEKAYIDASNMMSRRDKSLEERQKKILKYIFTNS